MVVTRTGNELTYQRFNGLYDLESNWVDTSINKKQLKQLDVSFDVFIEKLTEMIDVETGLSLTPAVS